MNITSIKISEQATPAQVLSMVSNAEYDFVLLRNIDCKDVSINFNNIDENCLNIPAVIFINHITGDVYGNPIYNINIEANLKIHPFVSSLMATRFIPFAVLAKKDMLINVLKDSMFSTFLEMSIHAHNYSYKMKHVDGWFVSSPFKQADEATRRKISSRYDFLLERLNPIDEYVPKCRMIFLNHDLSHCTEEFNGKDIVLTDCKHKYVNVLRDKCFIVSTDSAVSADFYIILDWKNLYDIKTPYNSIAQISMPSPNSSSHVLAEQRPVKAVFGVKQQSNNINFEPPYTRSSLQILTAAEIVLSFKPKSLTILSTDALSAMNVGDNHESISRHVFMTKIVDFCHNNDIQLDILGTVQ